MARPNQLRRLAAMIPILPEIEDGLISYAEIAEKMGCSIDEAMETMADLGDCDLDPGAFEFYSLDAPTCAEMLRRARLAGAGDKTLSTLERMAETGGVAVVGGFGLLSAPPRLSAPEARALASALDFSHVPDECPLRDKLASCVMPVAGGDELDLRAYIDRIGHYDTLRELSLLSSQRRLADIVYISSGRTGEVEPDDVEPRRIAPLQLVTADNGEVYLRAYCYRHGEMRTFRLDRVLEVVPLGEHAPREVLDLAEGESAPMAMVDPDADRALLRLEEGETIDPRQWLGARALPEEEALVELPLMHDHSWIARQLAARFGRVEALGPDGLRAEVAGCARELLAELDALEEELRSLS